MYLGEEIGGLRLIGQGFSAFVDGEIKVFHPLFLCKCGDTKRIQVSKVRYERTKTCGSIKCMDKLHENRKRKEFKGLKFGEFTITGKSKKNFNGHRLYEAICENGHVGYNIVGNLKNYQFVCRYCHSPFKKGEKYGKFLVYGHSGNVFSVGNKRLADIIFKCPECGKKFKRHAYNSFKIKICDKCHKAPK